MSSVSDGPALPGSPSSELQARAAALLVPALFLSAAVIGPALGDYALELGFRLALLLVLAEAWNLLAGYGGMVSLGTASFFGVGAYVFTGLLNHSSVPAGADQSRSAPRDQASATTSVSVNRSSTLNTVCNVPNPPNRRVCFGRVTRLARVC